MTVGQAEAPKSGAWARLLPIPASNAPWHPDVVEFALRFEGYEALGSFEALSHYANRAYNQWRNSGRLPPDMLHLRGCLYFEQRVQWHAEDGGGPDEPPAERFAYARALIEAIRDAADSPSRVVDEQEMR